MPELKTVQWYHVIADEVHKMKSRKAQQTRAIKGIKTTFKTALSGTPATNKPHDFWSILNWLWPTQFRSYWKFYAEHVDYDIVYPQGFHKIKGPKNVDKLLDQIGPYYVRHLKKERCCDHHPQGVMAYLPDKVYETQWVDLLPVQRRAYDEMNKELVAWVGAQRDKPLIAPVVVAKLIRLQQFAIAYCDVDTVEKGEFEVETHVRMSEPSSKLDTLMDIVEEHVEEGQQIVIFSQFSQAIRLLGVRLHKAGFNHALYTGDTKQSDRDRIVQGFLKGDIQVFAGTIKAGGVGLDLYTASTVVFIDRAWSPAENLQAEDRLHRHGQKNSVRVIDLMARNTIDLGRKQQIDLKWEWIKELLGDK
jgi:SNF2 family DNA or RNA helicase